MMSDPASEGTPTISTPSAVLMPNAHVMSSFQSVNPPQPMYYTPPSTQTGSVPTVVPQWHPSTITSQNINPSLTFFQTFLKGKPKALGILVIVAAILEIGLGIALTFLGITSTLLSGIPFWGSVFYIIAGSLTIAAQAKPNTGLPTGVCRRSIRITHSYGASARYPTKHQAIQPPEPPSLITLPEIKGSLGLNIVSSIFSMLAVILNIVDFILIPIFNYCYNDYDDPYNYALCEEKHNGGYAVISLLFVINLLLFCVTVSTSVFGCRSLSEVQSVTQVFVLQNDVFATNPGVVPVNTAYAQPPPQPQPYTVNIVKA